LTAVNRIGAQLQGFNRELRSDVRKQSDPGLDAQIHSALEELAELTNFTMLRGDDGTFTVFVGGQTPMVIGDSFYPLSVEFGSGQAVVRDAAGSDITAQIGNGRLRALLDFRSGFLPGVMAELNQLAEAIADQVNAVLVGGVDMFGLPPAVDLFTYDASRGSAATLAVTAILPEQLAAAQPQAPGGNGNALALARLFGTRAIQNFTFSQFFGETAGGAGRALSVARDSELTQGQLLAQAKAIRGEASAVSLDEEAAQLVAFQRAYQASAQLVRVLNEMTEEAIGLLR
jgi:flagellar hook-associated protein 1 FlgK